MSFFDKALQFAKDLATNTIDEQNKKANRNLETKEYLDSKSNEDLAKILNSQGVLGRSQTEKGLAFGILKSRGLSSEEIQLLRKEQM